MQIVPNRTELPAPGGLAGWLLGVLRGHESRKATKHLHIVEHLPLGGRRQLTLITCDGARFLVGGGPDGIQTIVPVQTPQPEASCL